MIVFDCPSCGKKLQVAEEHAGQTIACPGCKAKAPVPKAEEVVDAIEEAPEAAAPDSEATAVARPEHVKSTKAKRSKDGDEDVDDDRPRRKRDGAETGAKAAAGISIGLIIMLVVGLFACCLVGGVLVALLVPAVQKVREAAARTNSTNNLKQLGLGALSFQDVNRHLPFNGSDQPSPLDKNTPYSKNAVGNNPRSGTWAFQMLPFIEQQALFTAPNRAFGVQTFLCPARARPAVETTNGGGAWTDYFYNNYLNDPMQANRPDAPDMRRSLMKITDGTSNTVFAGHGNISVNQYSMSGGVTLSSNIFNGGTTGTMRAGQSARANPGGVTLARDSFNMPTVGSWGGPFPSGALMVFCDGSVRLVPYNTPNFGAALTPDGGEVLLLP